MSICTIFRPLILHLSEAVFSALRFASRVIQLRGNAPNIRRHNSYPEGH
jgi:hypothetical protein